MYKPYVQTQVIIDAIIHIDGMMHVHFGFDLDKFMANAFGEFKLYKSGYVCFNAGTET